MIGWGVQKASTPTQSSIYLFTYSNPCTPSLCWTTGRKLDWILRSQDLFQQCRLIVPPLPKVLFIWRHGETEQALSMSFCFGLSMCPKGSLMWVLEHSTNFLNIMQNQSIIHMMGPTRLISIYWVCKMLNIYFYLAEFILTGVKLTFQQRFQVQNQSRLSFSTAPCSSLEIKQQHFSRLEKIPSKLSTHTIKLYQVLFYVNFQLNLL